MLNGKQVSHLCHNPTCINPDHLIVETQSENEARKECANKINVVTDIGGKRYYLPAKACPHTPNCILREEYRYVSFSS